MKIDAGSLAIELLSMTEPRRIMSRLVRLGVEVAGADRCILASVDERVFRVEESYDRGRPEHVGNEYPLTYLARQPLISRAVTTGSIVVGGSLEGEGATDPALAPALDDWRRTAIIPLHVGTELGALLVLGRKSDEPFDAEDLERLRQIGGIGVVALRDVRLLERVTAVQRRGLDALTTMSQHLASSEEITVFFAKMSQSVAKLVGATRAAFWIIDGDRLVVQQHSHGFALADEARMSFVVESLRAAGFDGLLYMGKAMRFTRDGGASDLRADNPLASPDVHDFLAVPWRTAERSLGILVAYDSLVGFAEQDEWIMRLAARASALVWQGYTAEQRANELQATELSRLQAHAEGMAVLQRQKSDFMNLASHELRGPITVVRGYLSMLEDGTMGELPGNLHGILHKLQTRVDRINDLVNQMLLAARLEDSKLITTPRETSIDDLVSDVVASFAENGSESPAITVESPGGVRAYADRQQVETIIANLLSNALKYSPDAGEVAIVVREDRDDIEVDVVDHGVGIDSTDMARLFEPFERIVHPTTASVEGTGLGLYLSRELARLQAGDIEVRSVPGEGSTFTLRLPRVAPENAGERPDQTGQNAPTRDRDPEDAAAGRSGVRRGAGGNR